MDRNRLLPWIVCFSAALFFLYQFLQLSSLSAITPQLIHSLQMNISELGNLSSLYLYGLALSFIPAGLLLDHFSTRKLMLAAMLLAIVCTIIFSQSHSFFIAGASRFLAGMLHSIAFLGSCRMAAHWLSAQMALAMGCVATIGLLGGICSQIPLIVLVSHFGWRNALLVVAAFGVIIWIIMLLFLQDYPSQISQEVKLFGASAVLKNLKKVIMTRHNWVPSIYTALMNLPILVLGALWGVWYLTHENTITQLQAAKALSMIFVGTIIGCPLVGFISDKLQNRKLLMLIGAIISLFIALSILFNEPLSMHLLLILFFLLGFVTSTQVLSYPVITECNPKELTSSSLGFASIIIMGLGGFFQSVFGWIAGMNLINNKIGISLTSYQLAFCLLPFGFIISIALACLIPSHKNHQIK